MTKPKKTDKTCKTHGTTTFILEGRGYYRCRKCRSEAVSNRRRRVKLILVGEAGGKCQRCGYSKCTAALHFHHIDPKTKEFGIAEKGWTKGITTLRKEAEKCELLCANCHAEIEYELAQTNNRV